MQGHRSAPRGVWVDGRGPLAALAGRDGRDGGRPEHRDLPGDLRGRRGVAAGPAGWAGRHERAGAGDWLPAWPGMYRAAPPGAPWRQLGADVGQDLGGVPARGERWPVGRSSPGPTGSVHCGRASRLAASSRGRTGRRPSALRGRTVLARELAAAGGREAPSAPATPAAASVASPSRPAWVTDSGCPWPVRSLSAGCPRPGHPDGSVVGLFLLVGVPSGAGSAAKTAADPAPYGEEEPAPTALATPATGWTPSGGTGRGRRISSIQPGSRGPARGSVAASDGGHRG